MQNFVNKLLLYATFITKSLILGYLPKSEKQYSKL